MAGDYGYWLDDMSPGRSGPSTFGTLLLLAVVTIVLLALLSGPQATADSGRQLDGPACAEMRRLERHGVMDGRAYWYAARACADGAAVR
jgi:hypothetical protein